MLRAPRAQKKNNDFILNNKNKTSTIYWPYDEGKNYSSNIKD